MFKKILVYLVSPLVFFCPVYAKNVALVIGNATYEHESTLKSPKNDAIEIAKILRETHGYDVTELSDVTRDEFLDALDKFSDKAAEAEIALFFFSGHGLQINQRNFLVPTDASFRRVILSETEAISLQTVRTAVRSAKGIRIVILDACRDNKFPDGTKGSTKGLRKENAESGEIIAFATQANRIARDGDGRLSPFTQALTERMTSTPNDEVRILFTSLSDRVQELAGEPQKPEAVIGGMGPTDRWVLSGRGTGVNPDGVEYCDADLYKPAIYRTVTETVVEQEASVEYVSVPASYETYNETVVVQEATTELVTVPATFETVSETVVVQPDSFEYATIPAIFETVTDTVQVSEPGEQWVRCPKYLLDNISRDGKRQGSMCLVDVPAKYQTVARKVVKTPASTQERIIPAVTKQVERRVVKTPARVVERAIPAVTKTETRRRVAKPARTVERIVPAKTKQIARKVIDTPSQTTKGVAVCERSRTPTRILKLQKALNRAPFTERKLAGLSGYTVDASGLVRNSGKNIVGRLDGNGNVVSSNGQIIARTEDNSFSPYSYSRRGSNSAEINIAENGIYDEDTQAALFEYQARNNLLIGDWSLEAIQKLGVFEND